MRSTLERLRGAPLGRALIAAVLLSLLASAPASAQRGVRARDERARSLFREGLEFADHDDWERAVQRFRAALELRDTPAIRFNLARSLSRMGRLLEALDELANVLANREVQEDVRTMAQSLRTELEPRLGQLVVVVQNAEDDTHVTVDGRALARERFGLPTPTDPGVRVARLMRGTAQLDLEEVDVPEGGLSRVVLEGVGSAVTIAPPAAANDDALIWGLIAGGLVVAAALAITLGVVFGMGANQPSMGDFSPPILEFE